MNFDIDTGGCPIPGGAGVLPSMVRRAIEILDALPDGKLVSTRRMSELLGCAHNSYCNHTTHYALQPYKAAYKYNYNVYGNRATIAEYRKLKGCDGEG